MLEKYQLINLLVEIAQYDNTTTIRHTDSTVFITGKLWKQGAVFFITNSLEDVIAVDLSLIASVQTYIKVSE